MSTLGSFRAYTGIGSRDVTPEEYRLMVDIGERFAKLGWVLYSGVATGADSAYAEGSAKVEGGKHSIIFLPYSSFNKDNRFGENTTYKLLIKEQKELMLDLLEDTNTYANGNIRGKSTSTKNYHTRNCRQVLGTFENPQLSRVVVYCSDTDIEGNVLGGTSTAVALGKHYDVPTYNLRDPQQKESFLAKLTALEETYGTKQ